MNQHSLHTFDLTTPVLSAGGSQIRISAKGIEVITGAKFEAKAGQHVFSSGEKADISVPALPTFENKNWIAIEHLDADNLPFANLGYKIFFENNQVIEGKLDEQGKAHHDNVPDKAIRVEYEELPIEPDKPWDPFSQVIEKLSTTESQENTNNLTINDNSDV
jgi:type VI secretion system secreted protein VgrG